MNPLQQLRREMGCTQEQMAERLDVSLSTIRRWEALANPQRHMVAAYRGVFGSTLQSSTPTLRRLNDRSNDHDDCSPTENERYPRKVTAQSELSDDRHDVPSEPISIAEAKLQRPEPLSIRGRFAQLLGQIPADSAYVILLSGASGGGKSTAAMMMAQAISEHYPVLYCTSEESITSGTIGIRAEHAGIGDEDIDVVEVRSTSSIEDHLESGVYGLCVIDSVNELGMTPDDFMSLKNQYPDVSWILIAQANAAEKATVGGARWRHLVDIRLWCEVDKDGNRVVRNQKNRFAPSVNEIVMSRGKSMPAKPQQNTSKSTSTINPTEDTMTETDSWLMRRLESDLEQARAQIVSLQARLEARDLLNRELEMKVARYEIRDEMTEQGQQRQSLGDYLSPDKLASYLESLGALAPIFQSLFAGTTANDHTQNTSMMQVPQYGVAQPSHNYLSNPFAVASTTDSYTASKGSK